MGDLLQQLKEVAIEAEANVETINGEIASLNSQTPVDSEAVKFEKAKLKKAKAELKVANVAVKKEETAIARQAKKDEAEAKKQVAKEAREKKQADAKAEKERKAAEREANKMPEQNGIRRPKPDGKCGQTWAHADALTEKFGYPTPIADLLEVCDAEGLNSSNTKAEYARWRKFNNITGRAAHPKAEETASGK